MPNRALPEDPAKRAAARDALTEELASRDYGHRVRIVRINALDTPWGADDARAVAQMDCDAVLLPKTESADHVSSLAALVPGVPIWCMMETPRGVLNALEIAWPVTRPALEAVMREVIARNRVTTGLVYLQVTRGVAKRDFHFPKPGTPSTLVVTSRAIPPEHSPAASSSAVQVTLNLFTGSIRLWTSFVCKMFRTNSACAAPPATSPPASTQAPRFRIVVSASDLSWSEPACRGAG